MIEKQFQTFLEDLNSVFEDKTLTREQKIETLNHIQRWLDYQFKFNMVK